MFSVLVWGRPFGFHVHLLCDIVLDTCLLCSLWHFAVLGVYLAFSLGKKNQLHTESYTVRKTRGTWLQRSEALGGGGPVTRMWHRQWMILGGAAWKMGIQSQLRQKYLAISVWFLEEKHKEWNHSNVMSLWNCQRWGENIGHRLLSLSCPWRLFPTLPTSL